MRRQDGLVLSPADVTRHLGCRHITSLDLLALDEPPGALAPEPRPDEMRDLLTRVRRGRERAWLDARRLQGATVVQVDGEDPAGTQAAMRSGADVVHRPVLRGGVDGLAWRARPDALVRVPGTTALGGHGYEPVDVTLARRPGVPALVRLATGAQVLAGLQGGPVEHVHVVTGDGTAHRWPVAAVAAYARRARRRLATAVRERPATEPVQVRACHRCRWAPRCRAQWEAADDVCLVPRLTPADRERLRASGIRTVAALAALGPEGALPAAGTDAPAGVAPSLVRQAALLVAERADGVPRYELLPPAGGGLDALPPPSPGDLYLDFEGDPFAAGGDGLEYLAGLGDAAGGHVALWALDAAQEKEMTAELVGRIGAARAEDPAMHVYHYAPYEVTALRRLTARHGVREQQLEELLVAGVFVDLYAVVRGSVLVSTGSYSLKRMETFYWGRRRGAGDVADGSSSVVAFERWLEDRDDGVLAAIDRYNAEDVRSTRDLHRWLESLRAQRDRAFPRPSPSPSASASPSPSPSPVPATAAGTQTVPAGQTAPAPRPRPALFVVPLAVLDQEVFSLDRLPMVDGLCRLAERAAWRPR